MRTSWSILAAVAMASSAAHAVILHDSGGFEGDEFLVGTFTSGAGWTVGAGEPQPQIVDLNDGDHEKVLEIYRPLAPASSNNRISIDPLHSGILTLNFDFQTNTNYRSVTLAIAAEGDDANYFTRTTTSLTWGHAAGLVEHFYDGGWHTIGTFALNTWHAIEVNVYLSGPKAGTFDFQVDGGPPTTDIPWRVDLDLTQTGISEIWFQGTQASSNQGGGETTRYGRIDNVVVTWVPEPSSLALLSLGALCVMRRR